MESEALTAFTTIKTNLSLIPHTRIDIGSFIDQFERQPTSHVYNIVPCILSF